MPLMKPLRFDAAAAIRTAAGSYAGAID